MARLQINGLPNAAGGGVPAPLFSHRLLGVVHRVFDAQDDEREAFARLFLQGVRQIKLKRSVAAFVMAEVLAVAPAIGEEICGANVQDRPFIFPGIVFGELN